MSMLSAFISALVCFIVALCIVVSGVWNTGLTSTALTVAAFRTVFGSLGGWVVSFLSISFGIGVLVTYAYIAREAWLYLTKGRLALIFAFVYCLVAFVGALIDVHIVWTTAEIVTDCMLVINLFGIVYLIPLIKKGIAQFAAKK